MIPAPSTDANASKFLPGHWHRVRAARVPHSRLAALAPLRNRSDITIQAEGDFCWVRWQDPTPRIVSLLLPIKGAEFFFESGGQWFRIGSRLPLAQSPPNDAGMPLCQMLQPRRFDAAEPDSSSRNDQVPICIVRASFPQPATAMRCALMDLLRWSHRATSLQLAAIKCARAGEEILLLGSQLPAITSAARFWGSDLLLPLGFQIDPDLPESIIRSVFGTRPDDLLLIELNYAERIPRNLFQPLTRASLKLAAQSLEHERDAGGNDK